MDTLTKTANSIGGTLYAEYGYITSQSYKPLGKAAARVILDSPEVMGLVSALKTIGRMNTMPDHKINTITLGMAHRIALGSLGEFQKLREMVG